MTYVQLAGVWYEHVIGKHCRTTLSFTIWQVGLHSNPFKIDQACRLWCESRCMHHESAPFHSPVKVSQQVVSPGGEGDRSLTYRTISNSLSSMALAASAAAQVTLADSRQLQCAWTYSCHAKIEHRLPTQSIRGCTLLQNNPPLNRHSGAVTADTGQT
jgi:hypothetical protein